MNQRLPTRLLSARLTSFESLEARFLYSTYDILGVQAASLDQPQVYAIFRNSPTGNPLGGTGPDDGYAVKAFLDTGASGVLLSQEAAASDALNLTRATSNGQPIEFTDIGVGGDETFDVSTAVYGAPAPVTTLGIEELPVEAFDQSFGPVRTQIRQTPADFLVGELNVIGMPALQGKVTVMDPTPLNATDIFDLDSMRTYIYSPGTPYRPATQSTDPGIPNVNRHVKLSYGDFAKYTTTTPAGVQGPTLATNPFIGPNPVRAAGTVDTTPMIQLTEGIKSANGSFLLDTGASASFISRNIATQLGVRYRAGTYGSDNPILEDSNGNILSNQFTVPIGGIGDAVNVAGFFTDSLTLPTTEGEGIRFLQAPVLVLDITLEDPVSHTQITLDGDFGMNFLVASFAVDGTIIGDSAAGAFDWITFDQPNGILGLNLPDLPPGPPPAVTTGIASWSSAGTHARGVGEVALSIPDDGSFSEARLSGISTVLVTFDGPIAPASLTTASVGIWGNDINGQPVNLNGVTVATSIRAGNTVAAITFSSPLPDNAKYLVRLTGVTSATGTPIAGDTDRILTALLGDATGDRRVNNTDVGAVQSLRGIDPILATDVNQARSDVTMDGRINNTDVSGVLSTRGKDARFIADPTPTGSLSAFTFAASSPGDSPVNSGERVANLDPAAFASIVPPVLHKFVQTAPIATLSALATSGSVVVALHPPTPPVPASVKPKIIELPTPPKAVSKAAKKPAVHPNLAPSHRPHVPMKTPAKAKGVQGILQATDFGRH